MAIFLDEAQVTELLDMPSCIAALEDAFKERAAGSGPNIARRRVPFGGRRFMIMGGALSRRGYCGFKAYGAGAGQDIAIYRSHEGLVALIRSSRLGQMRTGAASGLATKCMARPDASRLGCFGTGHQAETQILAVAQVRKLESVLVYGRDPARRKAFAERMSGMLDLEVRPAQTPADCVKGRDILCTITSASQPLFDGRLVEPGAHINAAGANTRVNRELDEHVLTRAGTIATDDLEGAKLECGDLDWPIDRGLLTWDRVRELASVVAGIVPGRRSAEEITLFESQGIALEDIAAGALVYERALERGVGTKLPF